MADRRLVVANQMRRNPLSGLHLGLDVRIRSAPVSRGLRKVGKLRQKDREYVVRNIMDLIDADGDNVVVTPSELNKYFLISSKGVSEFVAGHNCLVYGKNNRIGASREDALRYLSERKPQSSENAVRALIADTLAYFVPLMNYN